MCGIFGYISSTQITDSKYNELVTYCNKIKHRGPDDTKYLLLNQILFGFHRLRINDLTHLGDQPMTYQNNILMCNGEIYNYSSLSQTYNFNLSSKSDCEIILHLYNKFGIVDTLTKINGYFGLLLWDNNLKKLYIARDSIGVRQLYIGYYGKDICVCSEMKGIPDKFKVTQFPPGSYLCYPDDVIDDNNTIKFTYRQYYKYEYPIIRNLSLDDQLIKIRNLFEKAVKKRFMSDRPIGVLLSGGLDSSLIAGLVAKFKSPVPIHTFSIGMNQSTDLYNARLVAEHIKSIHHEIIVTSEQMLEAIPEVIKQIESWDTTTVRASTPMYLLSKYIEEKTDIVVIYSGEGSDEAGGGYLYFHKCPDDDQFQEECIRLLKDIHKFDCLRADKSTAGKGLEIRVPFLDTEFIEEYMKVPPEWKRPYQGIEKWFIRKAFDGINLIPDQILWRRKEAFSDGVSSIYKSWYQIIQEHVDTIISDTEYNENKDKYTPQPVLKESYYYRKLFNQYYPNHDHTIPYYWLPKWNNNIIDPSARILSNYSNNITK